MVANHEHRPCHRWQPTKPTYLAATCQCRVKGRLQELADARKLFDRPIVYRRRPKVANGLLTSPLRTVARGRW